MRILKSAAVRSCLLAPVLAMGLLADAGSESPRAPAAKSQPMPSMLNTAPLEKLRKMTPAQREKIFSKLPPARQEALRKRLEFYESLTPQQRVWLNEQYKLFRQLPPERQEEMRRLYRRFNAVTEDRKAILQREFLLLRRLNEVDRKKRMESKDFRAKFTPQERRLLSEMADVVAAAPAGANAQ